MGKLSLPRQFWLKRLVFVKVYCYCVCVHIWQLKITLGYGFVDFQDSADALKAVQILQSSGILAQFAKVINYILNLVVVIPSTCERGRDMVIGAFVRVSVCG